MKQKRMYTPTKRAARAMTVHFRIGFNVFLFSEVPRQSVYRGVAGNAQELFRARLDEGERLDRFLAKDEDVERIIIFRVGLRDEDRSSRDRRPRSE